MRREELNMPGGEPEKGEAGEVEDAPRGREATAAAAPGFPRGHPGAGEGDEEARSRAAAPEGAAATEDARPAGAPAAAAPPAPEEPFEPLFERALTLLESELERGVPRRPADPESPLPLLERAYALRPDEPDVLYALGMAYGVRALAGLRANGGYLDDRTGAEAALQKAILAYARASELDPKCFASLNNLAALHALRGDRTLAIEALKRSLQIFPDQPQVRERLEELGAF